MLDQSLSELHLQTLLHNWQGATDQATGYEHFLEALQRRLDALFGEDAPAALDSEHIFGTAKARMELHNS